MNCSRPQTYRIRMARLNQQVGTAAEFMTNYSHFNITEPGEIVLGDRVIHTTPKVVQVLKAVLLTGCCTLELRAVACREIFIRALQIGPYIDEAALLNSFVDDDPNPFVGIVQDTIRGLLT